MAEDKKLEYPKPEMSDEQKEVLQAINNLMGGSSVQSFLEEKSRYTVALELFKLGKDREQLPLITHLDKEHVEILTRHDTLIDSAEMLFHIKPNDRVLKIPKRMGEAYMIYQISRDRKSRIEVKDILASAIDAGRTIGDKLAGRR